jgi:predicted lysophospholipase L1 biosynthesis ABC-type transport system permease subunit
MGAALAARSGLAPGAKIALATQTWSADAIVRGAMSAVPTQSDGDAVLLDLGALVRDVLRTQQAPPATNEVWLRTDDTAGVAAWANRIDAGASVTRATNAVSDRFLNSAFVALALGCVGALALTGVALAATLLTLRRRRRGEVVHLRALGFTTRQQAAMRRVELGTVALAALIVGCVLGVLVFAVLAAPLARLSVLPQAPAIPVTLGVDPVWLCSVVGALLALIAVLVALAGRGISANRPRIGQEDDR